MVLLHHSFFLLYSCTTQHLPCKAKTRTSSFFVPSIIPQLRSNYIFFLEYVLACILYIEKRQRSWIQCLSVIATPITRTSIHIHQTHPPRVLRYMLHLGQPHADGDGASHRATKPHHNRHRRPLQQDQNSRPTQTNLPHPLRQQEVGKWTVGPGRI